MENFEFEVLFDGSEEEFIHNTGVNRGYHVEINKVTRCLLLSSDAKILYSTFRSYAYNGRSECYPGMGRLMVQLGWSANKLKKYIEELEQKEFIRVEKKQGRFIYRLVEYHKIPTLYHSEILSSLIPSAYREAEAFKVKLEQYMESDLYKLVEETRNPIAFEKEIIRWFKENEQEEHEEEAAESEPVEVQNNTINQRIKLAQKVVNTPSDVKREKEKSLFDVEKPQKKKGLKYNSIPIDEWKSKEFCDYFADKYKEVYGSAFVVTMAHMALMARIREAKNDNEKLKTQIDIYFENPDIFNAPNIFNFNSPRNQSILDEYYRTGEFPSYLKKKTEKEDDTDEYDFKPL